MLKVVGASWHKTRIGTGILVGAGLFVICTFFLTGERMHYDGTYCATATWSKKYNFQVEYLKQQNDIENIPKGVARICYKDSIYENGWAQLEVETQREYPDWIQAFAAGTLEGSLTWSNIYHQWLNTISSACDKDDDSQNFCTWLRDSLNSNYEQMKAIAEENSKTDNYWHQIRLFFWQLEGVHHGWTEGAIRSRSGLEEDIDFVDILLMNAAADIQDLKIYFENFVLHKDESAADDDEPKNFFLPSATMLTKIFRSSETANWKVLFGHTSAASYNSMLRIQKRYKFRFHLTPDQMSNTVPGKDIMFTGYPGILSSTDDFYIIKGRQVHALVAGVAIKNDNLELWRTVNMSDVLPMSARVMAANRMAQTRRSWAKVMHRQPGTGNKQWIQIDLNKIDALEVQNLAGEMHILGDDRSARTDAVWIVEELPGNPYLAKDVSTQFLADNATWVGNGVPYFEEMLQASTVSRDNFSIDHPDENQLQNLEDVERYLREHAFRGDLLGDELIAYGNIDMKLFSYDAGLEMSDFHALSGPPYHNGFAAESDLEIIDRRPVRNDLRALAMRKIDGPFKWSSVTDRIPGIEHMGHPDEWNFQKVSPKWHWHD